MTEIKLDVLMTVKTALNHLLDSLSDMKMAICVVQVYVEKEIERVSDL